MQYFRLIAQILEILEKGDRVKLLLLQILIIFTGIAEVLGIASIMPFIGLLTSPNLIRENQYIQAVYLYLNFSEEKYFLIFLGVCFLVLTTIGNFLNAITIGVNAMFTGRINTNFSERLMRYYITRDFVLFSDLHSSKVGNRLLSEVSRLAGMVVNPLLIFNSKLITLFFVFIALIVINPWATIAIFMTLSISYFAIYRLLKMRLTQISKLMTEEGRLIARLVTESIQGIREMKVYGLEERQTQEFHRRKQRLNWAITKSILFGALPKYLIETVSFGGLIFLCVYFILSGEIKGFLPLISLYAIAGYRMLPMAQNIYQSVTSVKANVSAFYEIRDDLAVSRNFPTGKSAFFAGNKILFRNKISLENVSFKYPGSESKQINRLNLEIRKNTSVAFVGKTGCGKTTLINVILGLLSPNQGTVKIDNLLLTRDRIKSWQQNLAFVAQDVFLIENTIVENIAFGVNQEEIDFERVKQVAQIADIGEFIESLPNAYESMIGERGINLSGGQRQRIAIARALYRKPEILVLDEATSALDNETERNVMKSIDKMKGSQTLILIAHRITTVKNCDVIFLLKEGKVVEKGTYQELSENSEAFQRFL